VSHHPSVRDIEVEVDEGTRRVPFASVIGHRKPEAAKVQSTGLGDQVARLHRKTFQQMGGQTYSLALN